MRFCGGFITPIERPPHMLKMVLAHANATASKASPKHAKYAQWGYDGEQARCLANTGE